MRFQKIFSTQIERCYAAGCTVVNGRPLFLLGTEVSGPVTGVDPATLEMREVCPGPGGTMSLIPLPGKNGDFLHIHSFFPVFQSKEAGILWSSPAGEGWQTRPLLSLPYLHRFDVFAQEGRTWLLGCTLCTSKREQEDWSDPGKLWAGLLPDEPGAEVELRPVMEGLLKNHGYCRTRFEGEDAGIITCNSGVYAVRPPLPGREDWRVEQLLSRPISDVAVCDIDGDGEDELLLLEGFHGNGITINKRVGVEWQIVWEFPRPVEFVHVAWGGLLRGRPAFLAGSRRLDGGLSCITWEAERGFALTDIEFETGPSNVCVLQGEACDYILAANHRIGEGAIYRVTDG